MFRVIFWTLGGAGVGFVTVQVVVATMLDAGISIRIRDGGGRWLLFTMFGVLPGAVFGAIFGAADTILRELRSLRNDVSKRPKE